MQLKKIFEEKFKDRIKVKSPTCIKTFPEEDRAQRTKTITKVTMDNTF